MLSYYLLIFLVFRSFDLKGLENSILAILEILGGFLADSEHEFVSVKLLELIKTILGSLILQPLLLHSIFELFGFFAGVDFLPAS